MKTEHIKVRRGYHHSRSEIPGQERLLQLTHQQHQSAKSQITR